MSGRYDDSVFWPFSNMVTVSLIDQRPGGKHLQQTLDTGAETLSRDVSEFYQRPKEDSNKLRGWPKFISHGELCKRSFTSNNQVVLQLCVHIS